MAKITIELDLEKEADLSQYEAIKIADNLVAFVCKLKWSLYETVKYGEAVNCTLNANSNIRDFRDHVYALLESNKLVNSEVL